MQTKRYFDIDRVKLSKEQAEILQEYEVDIYEDDVLKRRLAYLNDRVYLVHWILAENENEQEVLDIINQTYPGPIRELGLVNRIEYSNGWILEEIKYFENGVVFNHQIYAKYEENDEEYDTCEAWVDLNTGELINNSVTKKFHKYTPWDTSIEFFYDLNGNIKRIKYEQVGYIDERGPNFTFNSMAEFRDAGLIPASDDLSYYETANPYLTE